MLWNYTLLILCSHPNISTSIDFPKRNCKIFPQLDISECPRLGEPKIVQYKTFIFLTPFIELFCRLGATIHETALNKRADVCVFFYYSLFCNLLMTSSID